MTHKNAKCKIIWSILNFLIYFLLINYIVNWMKFENDSKLMVIVLKNVVW